MIQKIIHYCWLSNNPIPVDLQNCMASWKKFLPDYEIIWWNFERFPKSKSRWVNEAFDKKKYAFAADYIRLYALYNYGGIYLDMDVEIRKKIDDFLVLKTMIGYENSKAKGLEVAAFAVEKHSPWVKICLDYYDTRSFINTDGSLNVQPLPCVVKRCLIQNGYKLINVTSIEEAKDLTDLQIPVFSYDYFSPKDHVTGKIEETNNTFSIHHFASSWEPFYFRIEKKFWHSLGLRDMRIILRMINLIKYGSVRSIPKRD